MHQSLLLRYFGGLFWLTLSTGFTPAPPAAPLPGSSELQLGKPAVATPVSLSESTDGSVLLVGKTQAVLPLRQARTLRSESFTLAGGHSVGLVRAGDGTREAAALVVRKPSGAVEVIWTGALFLRGDPGERQADAIEVADRDGDKRPDLIVGTYDERVRVCGQERALLAPRALDPKTLTLRSVLLNRLDPQRDVHKLTASAQAPEVQGPPLLRALHPTSASSSARAAAGADIRAVVDGDLTTFWSEGRGLGGRFEFLSLRWAAPEKPITALSLVLPAAPSGGQPFAVARKISISPEQGPRLEISLPQGVAPGQRYWITPKTPLRSNCLTVSLDDVAQSGPQVHAAIAELEAYTDLDRAGGVQTLLDELIHDGPRAADATDLLLHTSADIVPQLSAALPSLSPNARRRALRVLSARAGTDDRALELVALASRDSDPEVARAALTTLVQHLPRSQNLLLATASAAGRGGDEAAIALARKGGASSLRGLLDLLASEPRAAERIALRDALGLAFRHAGPDASAVVDAWRQQPTLTLQARAAASLALAAVVEAKPSAAQLLTDSLQTAGEFPERWRLVRAAAQLPSEPKTDAWLADVVASAKEWMLRSAALEALEARRTPAALPAAKAALSDSYPRVRARALRVLSGDRASIDVLAHYARKDEWFLVRAAALTALPDATASRAAMVEALRDPSPIVRSAAIHALRRVHAADAWPSIEPLVANSEEYPDVIEAGVAFARALCLERAAPTLQDVVKRGLRPEAWTADQELALGALEALTHLGGEHAKWAVQRMAAPIVPPSVRAAAERAVAQPRRCEVE